MSQSNLNIIMVMIGLFLAMSLDMLVQDILIGSIELAVCVGLFIMFNHKSDTESESK